MKRRIPTLLLVLATALAVCTARLAAAEGKEAAQPEPVPMIHVTDLFRPHNDPDDHWDLACVYALACQGKADLLGILIDYPQPGRGNDPDVLAVAQLNYLSGKAVPVLVGSPRWYDDPRSGGPASESDLRGVRAMLDLLRRSPRPVVINVLGSCRDVALAGKLEPELFARKCRAIYLNAGSGTPDAAKARRLEWNVHLDPVGYSAIFDLPCPVYWMPCFEEVPAPGAPFRSAEYGTFWRFRQGDVLPHLSPGVQNYFAYMFLHGGTLARGGQAPALRPNWLQVLVAEPDPDVISRINAMDRNMWCTGGFLHAVGLTVTRDGRIVPFESASGAVFTFDPVDVSCSRDGVTRWTSHPAQSDRFLFHVRDVDRYPAAMTSALRSLLDGLP